MSNRVVVPNTFSIYSDEVEVQVISPVGSYCGTFAWPASQVEVLEFLNKQPSGYYLAWRPYDAKPNEPFKSHKIKVLP